MNIYLRKRRWKFILFTAAIIIVAASLYYTNVLVRQFAVSERTNVRIWANAIQRKAVLVNYADTFFQEIRESEESRANLLAETFKRLSNETITDEYSFYLNIISGNKTVPIIITDDKGKIKNHRNVDFNADSIMFLKDDLKREFTQYQPIEIVLTPTEKQYLYYKDSRIFTELRHVLDDLIETFFSEVVTNSVSVPVIVTDSTQSIILEYGNLDSLRMQNPQFVERTIASMRSQNDPIQFNHPETGTTYIFYKDSDLLTQIKYYPLIQFIVIGLFFIIAYVLFSTARKSEQNQVWVGMSKETAHQLGTPLSSIIAWVELLKLKGVESETIGEMEKDLGRLENITERFSKIGSPAKLETQNIVDILYDSIEYIKRRTSKKVKYRINVSEDENIQVAVNKNLFEWVLENLFKNAVDAMNGVGILSINITEDKKVVIIDFNDTGKGITKANFKSVFSPGFTSKKRGWGLGLSLSKRIISEYHKGKIFVKSSVLDQGTTFRIMLKK